MATHAWWIQEEQNILLGKESAIKIEEECLREIDAGDTPLVGSDYDCLDALLDNVRAMLRAGKAAETRLIQATCKVVEDGRYHVIMQRGSKTFTVDWNEDKAHGRHKFKCTCGGLSEPVSWECGHILAAKNYLEAP